MRSITPVFRDLLRAGFILQQDKNPNSPRSFARPWRPRKEDWLSFLHCQGTLSSWNRYGALWDSRTSPASIEALQNFVIRREQTCGVHAARDAIYIQRLIFFPLKLQPYVNCICNKTFWVKLETNEKQKHFYWRSGLLIESVPSF